MQWYIIGMKKWLRHIAASVAVMAVAILIYWKAEACDAKASETFLCRVLAPANLPNVFLVLVGIAGIIVAIGTLEILGRQTDIFEKSADAALLNAQAVMNSERAWLVVELKPLALRYSDGQWYRFVEDKPVAMSAAEILAGQHLQYTLRFINLGKTPAFIVKYEIYCLRANVPREVIEFGQPYLFLAGGGLMDMETINVSEYTKTTASTDWVLIGATVSYQHVFSKTYVAEEQAVYRFSTETNSLQRIVGIPPGTYEKQQKQEAETN